MTPGGLQHLDEVQHELIHEMVDLFAVAKENILAAILKDAGPKPRRVAVCGSGHLAQLVRDTLQSSGIDVSAGYEDDAVMQDVPDALVVALEFPWALDNLEHLLEHAGQRGIRIVRLNGHLAQGSNQQSAISNPQSAVRGF
jgi:hypothetical protein